MLAEVEDVIIPCPLPECIEATHSYPAGEPRAVDPHIAGKSTYNDGDPDFPTIYDISVFREFDTGWRTELRADDCYMSAESVAKLSEDLRRMAALAADLNAQDAINEVCS